MQRWVHEQGWTSLHDAQERAIGPIVSGDRDVIIAAATAAGKTEAAFLPIISNLVLSAEQKTPVESDPWTAPDPWAEPESAPAPGVQVLCVSPLKALINDQFDRLEEMCGRVDVSVHRWHGDVSSSAKSKVLSNPSGVLLITPESLEATFVNRGTQVAGLFAGLQYIVIDELHSFLATPRGAQLQSLLSRIELAIRRRPPRIGLSATLGDMVEAGAFLRPTAPDRVLLISSVSDSRSLQLQLRGYVATPPESSLAESRSSKQANLTEVEEEPTPSDKAAIATHLYEHLRGRDNLVFANSRGAVEVYADLLSRRSETERVPNEFWPHHGSLSREMRDTVEAQLKDRSRPATAICTSTLEMGIDIGTVAAVAQIGPPPSVAALRQRLGRSGRRDDPAVLRMYVSEEHLDERSHPVDELRCSVVQSTAMVQLMLGRWLEAPEDPGFNYSTLIQQVLSTIAQHGGATAVDLHRALCGPGPFALVDQSRFVRLLRAMAEHELVVQSSDGLLLHGSTGEYHVNHYSFYTAFQTTEEWRLTAGGNALGTVPISQPLYEGVLLIFAGKRWKVIGIDSTSRVVELERSFGGNPPSFGGGAALVSDRVRAQMVEVYRSDVVPAWLDTNAKALLAEGRSTWQRFSLDTTTVLSAGSGVLLLPWLGDRALFTATIALLGEGVEAVSVGPAVEVSGVGATELFEVLDRLCTTGPPPADDLAALMENREVDKWDWVLDDALANESAAARRLDVEGAWTLLARARDDLATASSPPPLGAGAEVDPITTTEVIASLADLSPPIPTSFELRRSALFDQEFCVVDVETTGFSPRLGDRVVEIAAVRMRGDGTILKEWSTLIDPGRDVGPTHVHGITASDIVGAPRFSDVVGDLLNCLEGSVLVAHNLRFDHNFLSSEFTNATVELPQFPALCTLSLGSLVQPGASGRSLNACCEHLGIDLTDAHTAAADARATAQVLASYLRMAVERGCRTLDDIGCVPLEWPESTSSVAPSLLQQLRGSGERRIDNQGRYLAGLVERLEGVVTDSDVAEYLNLLDRALEDRRLTDVESEALAATAAEWGLAPDAVRRAHEDYFSAVLAAAVADGVVTDLEYADLRLVGSLLQLEKDEVERRLNDVELTGPVGSPSLASVSLAGLSVCFTGALIGRIDGEPITRMQAHQFAESAGLTVRNGMSKGLDILVVADADSQSGKARKAREYGTRVMAEQVFWSTVGVRTD